MKKVIISGASGFIGNALTCYLLAKNIEVHAIVRSQDSLIALSAYTNLKIIVAEFEQYKDLSAIIETENFDAFFHFAWAGYGTETNNYHVQISNVFYTCEAIESAVKLKVKKFIFAGSCHQYQKNYYLNDFNANMGFSSIYGAAKTSAEQFCRVIAHNADIQFNSVLFAHVFGPGDTSKRSSQLIIKKILDGEEIDLIKGENLYDWTYIDDVVEGVYEVFEKGIANKSYYVGNKELKPFRAIIDEVKKILKVDVKINYGRYPDTSFIDYSYIDISQLYEDTGYVAKNNFPENIQKTAAWIKQLNI